MLRIEFTGCTGAGKTRLARAVRHELERRGVPVWSPFELAFGRRAGRWVVGDSRRNLALDVVLLPLGTAFCIRHAPLALLLFGSLTRHDSGPVRTLRRARGVLGKLGTHVLLGFHRRRAGCVLVDEGIVHTLHALVWDPAPLRPGVVERFGNLVPLVGHLVFVGSPLDRILDRTDRREDPPLRGAARTAMAGYARRALQVFAQLERHQRLAGRRLAVRPGEGAQAVAQAAAQVVEAIGVAAGS